MNSLKRYTLSLGIALLLGIGLAGCGRTGDQTTGSASREEVPQLTDTDRRFMMKAAEVGMAEIRMGELARERASSDKVKDLGEQVAGDHREANEDLRELAKEYNVALPIDTDQEHQQKIDRLANLSGSSFDREFVQAQIEGHQKAIELFQDQANLGTTERVKDFASDKLSELRNHLERAKEIQTGR
jgi:putative membrane protein